MKENKINLNKAHKTFATRAREIERKYKGAEHDPVLMKDMIRELDYLQEEQEAVRAKLGMTNESKMNYGGRMKYNGFNSTQFIDPPDGVTPFNPKVHKFGINWPLNETANFNTGLGNNMLDTFYNNFNKSNYNPIVTKGNKTVSTKNKISTIPDYSSANDNYDIDYSNAPDNYLGTNSDVYDNSSVIDYSSANDNYGYDETIGKGIASDIPEYEDFKPEYWKSWYGLAPLAGSLAGNLYMGLSAKERPINYGRVSPQLINLQRQRDIAQRNADISKRMGQRGIREAGANLGQVLANTGSMNAGIDRNLGEQLGQSYLNEEVTNKGTLMNTNAKNVELAMLEEEARTKEADAVRAQKLAALNSGMQALNQYGQNAYADKMTTDMLNTLQDEAGYRWLRDKDKNPVRVFTGTPAYGGTNEMIINNTKYRNGVPISNKFGGEITEEKQSQSFYEFLKSKRLKR